MNLRELKDLLFTDYRIKSENILGNTILLNSVIIAVFFIVEVLVDLRSTSILILTPFLIITYALLLAFHLKLNRERVASAYVIFQYLVLEVHILVNPTVFHVMIYWFPFVIVSAIVVRGVKQSLVWLAIIIVSIITNGIYGINTIGESYTVSINYRPFIIAGIVFSLASFLVINLLYRLLGRAYEEMKDKNEALDLLRNKEVRKKEKLEKYQNALFELSKDKSVFEENFGSLYAIICKVAYDNLGVDQVSVWTFSNNFKSINRVYIFNNKGGSDVAATMEKSKYPNYFKAIETKEFIAVDDTLAHPDTLELYPRPVDSLNISSLLDSSISIDGEKFGLISCEHQGEKRHWSTEDILFSQSLSDFISLSTKSYQVWTLLEQIRSQNMKLKDKGKQINAVNEELNHMNESLDSAVKQRTKELELQNKQLTEYAFINSHLLRAPLSRILGLCHIISLDRSEIQKTEVLDALINSTEELDVIVHKISDLLYDGTHFSREEIGEMIKKTLISN